MAITANTTASYVVRAFDATGNNSVSNSASATTYVFSDGFETGNTSKWTTANNFNVRSTQANSGSFSGEAATSNRFTQSNVSKTFAATATGGLFHTVRQTNGSWQGWGNVKNQIGDIMAARAKAEAG